MQLGLLYSQRTLEENNLPIQCPREIWTPILLELCLNWGFHLCGQDMLKFPCSGLLTYFIETCSLRGSSFDDSYSAEMNK